MIATATIDMLLDTLPAMANGLYELIGYLGEHESETTSELWGASLAEAKRYLVRVIFECREMADEREAVTP